MEKDRWRASERKTERRTSLGPSLFYFVHKHASMRPSLSLSVLCCVSVRIWLPFKSHFIKETFGVYYVYRRHPAVWRINTKIYWRSSGSIALFQSETKRWNARAFETTMTTVGEKSQHIKLPPNGFNSRLYSHHYYTHSLCVFFSVCGCRYHITRIYNTHACTSLTIAGKYEKKNDAKEQFFVAIFSISISLYNKRLQIIITFKQERVHSKIHRMSTFTFNHFKLKIILTLTCDEFSNEMHIPHGTTHKQ